VKNGRLVVNIINKAVEGIRKLWQSEVLIPLKKTFFSELTIREGDYRAKFEIESEVAREWFFPRYGLGQAHEASVLSVMMNNLNRDDVFLDVGGHLGFYSIFAALQCKEAHSFEIDPSMAAVIERNVRLNQLDNVYTHPYAVTGEVNRLVSFEPHQTENKSTNRVSGERNRFFVPTFTLDECCEQLSLEPSMIKIDVEGAEFDVLRGMKTLLSPESSLRRVFLEVHPNLVNSFDDKFQETLDRLESLNFKVERFPAHRAHHTTTPVNFDRTDPIEDNTMLDCYRP